MNLESYCDGSSRWSRTGIHVVTVVVGTDKRRLLHAATKMHITEQLASINVENITGMNLCVKVNRATF